MFIQIMRLLLSFSCFIALAVVSKGQTPSNVDNEIGGSQVCGNWVAEVYFLINNSRSFRDDFELLKVQASEIMKEITRDMPGSTVGFGVFSDKSAVPEQQYPNMCYHHLLDFTTSITHFSNAMKSVEIARGYNDVESSHAALYHAINSETVAWSTGQFDSTTGQPILRLLFLVVGDLPRKAGDGVMHEQLEPLSRKAHDDTKEDECYQLRVPTDRQIVHSFREKNIHPIFMIHESVQPSSVKQSWINLNEKIDNGGSVVDLETSSTNFLDVVKKGLKTVSCNVPTPPTTPKASSVPAKQRRELAQDESGEAVELIERTNTSGTNRKFDSIPKISSVVVGELETTPKTTTGTVTATAPRTGTTAHDLVAPHLGNDESMESTKLEFEDKDDQDVQSDGNLQSDGNVQSDQDVESEEEFEENSEEKPPRPEVYMGLASVGAIVVGAATFLGVQRLVAATTRDPSGSDGEAFPSERDIIDDDYDDDSEDYELTCSAWEEDFV